MSWTWTATEAHLPLEGLGRQTGQTLRTGGPGGDETAERSPRGWRPGRPRACVQEALKAQLGDRERPLNGSKEEKSALREGWRETRGRVPSSRRERERERKMKKRRRKQMFSPDPALPLQVKEEEGWRQGCTRAVLRRK